MYPHVYMWGIVYNRQGMDATCVHRQIWMRKRSVHTQSVAQPQSARNDAVCSHRDGRRDDRAQRVSQTEKHRACGVTCAESTVNDTSDPIYKAEIESQM